MRAAIIRLFTALLMVAASNVLAEQPVAQYSYLPFSEPDTWRDTGLAACEDFKTYNNAQACTGARVLSINAYSAGSCSFQYSNCAGQGNSTSYTTSITTRSFCPAANAVPVSGVCPPPVQQPSCPASGTSAGVQNVTIGYTRSPDAGAPFVFDYFTTAEQFRNANICKGGCKLTMGASGTNGWSSQVPTAQGLYRQSVDWNMVHTGASCTASSTDQDAIDPAKSPPSCPGTTGTVNGVPVCIGSGGTQGASPSGQTTRNGNPASGSSPDGVSNEARTPSTGNGGNAGGPRTSTQNNGTVQGSGTGSGGTVPSPADGTEQAACGAPGQPPCRIDESGTPTPVPEGTELDGLKADGATKESDIIGAINAQRAHPPWTWTFQLPTGCTPYTVPALNVVLDICEWQPMFHNILGMMWIAATIFAIVGMASRAFWNGD